MPNRWLLDQLTRNDWSGHVPNRWLFFPIIRNEWFGRLPNWWLLDWLTRNDWSGQLPNWWLFFPITPTDYGDVMVRASFQCDTTGTMNSRKEFSIRHDRHHEYSCHHGKWFCPSLRLPSNTVRHEKLGHHRRLLFPPSWIHPSSFGSTFMAPSSFSSRPLVANHDTHRDDHAANKIETFSRRLPSKQSMVQLSPIDVWSTGPTPGSNRSVVDEK